MALHPLHLAADLASVPELLAAVLLRRRVRPLSAVLLVDVASDLAQRLLLAHAHRAPGVHYEGADRVLFHAAQAAHLAWPALVAWAAWRLLRPEAPRWPVLPAWTLAVAVAVVAYPLLPADVDSPVYLAAQALAVVAGLGAVAAWRRAPRSQAREHAAALVVVLGELAVLIAPYLVAPLLDMQPSEAWALALVPRYATWCALCVVGW